MYVGCQPYQVHAMLSYNCHINIPLAAGTAAELLPLKKLIMLNPLTLIRFELGMHLDVVAWTTSMKTVHGIFLSVKTMNFRLQLTQANQNISFQLLSHNAQEVACMCSILSIRVVWYFITSIAKHTSV